VTDMRLAIGIGDGGGDVERIGHKPEVTLAPKLAIARLCRDSRRSQQGPDLHRQQSWVIIVGRHLARQPNQSAMLR
jgi:hypothetical protein